MKESYSLGFLPYICLPTVCWAWKPKIDFLCLSILSKFLVLCWRCCLTWNYKLSFLVILYWSFFCMIGAMFINKLLLVYSQLNVQVWHLTKFGLDLRMGRNDNSDQIWLTFLIIHYQFNKQGHTHDQGSMEVWGDLGAYALLWH